MISLKKLQRLGVKLLNTSVHFALKQNEPKSQGCETIGDGHWISATFYQWSTKHHTYY